MKTPNATQLIMRYLKIAILFNAVFSIPLIHAHPAPSKNKIVEKAAKNKAAPKKKTTKKAATKWTILFYIQARNNLAPYAAQNLRDMAKSYGNKQVNIVVQWDQPGKEGAWRYKIEKESITLENYTEIKDAKNPEKSLVDFVKWGVENFPAQHYCLALWNHGTGILSPPFGNPMRVLLNNRELILNPRINIPGILKPELTDKQRCILFDDDNKVFLDSIQLQKALKKITSKQILGRKLDCIGFDACFMGMAEIAYQVRDIADYMIASEELVIARGWNYSSLTSSITSKLPTPKDFAKTIVKTYGEYYKGRTSYYTQSAIDLQHMNLLKQNLDDMVINMGICMKHHRRQVIKAVHRARNGCMQFSARVYVDLHSFCSKLLDRLTLEERVPEGYEDIADLVRRSVDRRGTRSMRTKKPNSPHIKSLIKSINRIMFTIEEAVLARVASKKFDAAKGLSIYFPYSHVNTEYRKSAFGKESLWTHFLDEVAKN